jgi:exodeoxyribonuclease-3
MRMQLDASEVDDPCKPGTIIDNDLFRCASRRERERYRSQPLGALRRRALLIERFTLGAIDVSFKDNGTVADSGERARRNRQVVADEVKFQEPGLLREVQLARVTHADLASVDREHFGSVFFRHQLILHHRRDGKGFVKMKIATYNVNGIGARLPALIRWLAESKPDVACLQELKAPQEKFPEAAVRDAGYGVIWHGQKSWNGVAILARGADPVESRRALPGDSEDLHSRYIEAMVNGVRVGCLYLPNGNPAPGPKFDYKLRWLERLTKHAQELLATAEPVVLAGDYNVIPTEIDVYKPEHWVKDALYLPEVRSAFANLVAMGWTDSIRKLNPDKRIYTFWDYFRNNYARDAGLRIDHLLLSPSAAPRLVSAGVDREVRGWEKASDHAPTWIVIED